MGATEGRLPLFEEARAVDGVGGSGAEGRQHGRQVGRVVLQVGVLHDGERPGHRLEAGAHGGALAAVVGVLQQRDRERVVGGQPIEDLAGAVGGAVVAHDELAVGQCRPHLAQQLLGEGLFVVDGDDHREAEAGLGGRRNVGGRRVSHEGGL